MIPNIIDFYRELVIEICILCDLSCQLSLMWSVVL